ncbi:hypothetical protein [Microbacterium sp. 77mftsu3.1]|uniref:hypothetical protein n=1 Tax=Microbacterium sp. 77mftsu3.1 TaxID=1761802 RepID=UPI00036B9709|nr:hypothetical protein [Microbacterium sp. 77mftsu3.1]SDH55980.1 hypothetical protein SAMN04488590_3577 [Microbacterium sp. 77mftsu3.1]
MNTTQTRAALADYLVEHGHYPRTKGAGADLRDWVVTEARKYHDGTLPATRVQAYDRSLPGWSMMAADGHRNTIALHLNARASNDHYIRHGAFPARTAKDPRAARLGVFLHHERNASRGNSQLRIDGFRIEALDRLAPGWDTTKPETWVNRARDLVTFVHKHGHYPRSIRDGHDGEHSLYTWHLHTLYAVNGDRRGGAPWQVAFLDRYLPGWQTRQLPAEDVAPDASLYSLWRAPRQGDIITIDGQPAIAVRTDLNPAAPVTVRVRGRARELSSVPHEITQTRTAASINITAAGAAAELTGRWKPYEDVDTWMTTHRA